MNTRASLQRSGSLVKTRENWREAEIANTLINDLLKAGEHRRGPDCHRRRSEGPWELKHLVPKEGRGMFIERTFWRGRGNA